MRSTLRSGALALTALFAVAACTGAGASPAARPRARHPRRSRARPRPARPPVRRRAPTPAPRPVSRSWHRASSRSGPTTRLPAVLHRRTRRATPSRGTSPRATRRPARVRERGRLRDRRQARLRQGRGRLGRRPVRQLVRAGPEDVRHRPQPGLLHGRPGRRRPTCPTATTSARRRSSPSRPARSRRRRLDRRAQGRQVRRPDRDDELRRDHQRHQADRPSRWSIDYERRRDPGAQGQADRRASSSTSRRPTSSRTSSSTRRPIVGHARPGRSRALQRGPRQGQPADRLRQRRRSRR